MDAGHDRSVEVDVVQVMAVESRCRMHPGAIKPLNIVVRTPETKDMLCVNSWT